MPGELLPENVISSHMKIRRSPSLSWLYKKSLKLYLNVLMYILLMSETSSDLNQFCLQQSSVVFGNLQKVFENVQKRLCSLSTDFWKSSENRQKCHYQYANIINKIIHDSL